MIKDTKMKRWLLIVVLMLSVTSSVMAQERKVENRPYTDLRPFHFGVLLGPHFQDIELTNVGPVSVTLEDGTVENHLITADQDRWDAGFQVGVLGEARLGTHAAFRVVPAMYFGTRHIVFHNFTQLNSEGRPTEQRQEMKTAYVSCAMDLVLSAQRFNNHRPYVAIGLNPMVNLAGRDNDYLRLNRYDTYAQIGLGCDLYLPFFKLRPELKFMYGLTNSINTKHSAELKDKNMVPHAMSVSKGRSKIIALTFYFE